MPRCCRAVGALHKLACEAFALLNQPAEIVAHAAHVAVHHLACRRQFVHQAPEHFAKRRSVADAGRQRVDHPLTLCGKPRKCAHRAFGALNHDTRVAGLGERCVDALRGDIGARDRFIDPREAIPKRCIDRDECGVRSLFNTRFDLRNSVKPPRKFALEPCALFVNQRSGVALKVGASCGSSGDERIDVRGCVAEARGVRAGRSVCRVFNRTQVSVGCGGKLLKATDFRAGALAQRRVESCSLRVDRVREPTDTFGHREFRIDLSLFEPFMLALEHVDEPSNALIGCSFRHSFGLDEALAMGIDLCKRAREFLVRELFSRCLKLTEALTVRLKVAGNQ